MTKRINLKKMGVRGGTEIVAIIVQDEHTLQIAIDYGKKTSLENRALLVADLFKSVVADIIKVNPGHEKEIFDDVRKLVDARLEQQRKGLDHG